MRVMVAREIAVKRKESLVELLQRVSAAFPVANLSTPVSPDFTLVASAPKALPLQPRTFLLTAPELGEGSYSIPAGTVAPGVLITEYWTFTGIKRELTLFSMPDSLAAVSLAAQLGKVTRTTQIDLDSPESPAGPEKAEAVAAVVAEYRSRMPEILSRVDFPHTLPSIAEALRQIQPGTPKGVSKSSLQKQFRPLGYSCEAGKGTYTLRRTTPSKAEIEISLDTGTWGRGLLAHFAIQGPGYRAQLRLHPTRVAEMGQYPIANAAAWQCIVENLYAVVAELEAGFVPAIESAGS